MLNSYLSTTILALEKPIAIPMRSRDVIEAFLSISRFMTTGVNRQTYGCCPNTVLSLFRNIVAVVIFQNLATFICFHVGEIKLTEIIGHK